MDSTFKLMKAKLERMWIQDNKHIHALNYWYYRWFTNSFRDYIIVRYWGD